MLGPLMYGNHQIVFCDWRRYCGSEFLSRVSVSWRMDPFLSYRAVLYIGLRVSN